MTPDGSVPDVTARVASVRDASVATLKARQFARALGFGATDEMAIGTAVSELVTNVVRYGESGNARFSVIERLGRCGMQAVIEDRGPGIADVEEAMKDHVTSGDSLGLGLPGIERMMDEFVLVSEVGVGTSATIRQWLK